MKLFTKNPINDSSVLGQNYLKEELYITPWDGSFFDGKVVSGDLREYFLSLGNLPPTVNILMKDEKSSELAYFQPYYNKIGIYGRDYETSTLVHEIQHSLQKCDGRTGGSSPERYAKEVIELIKIYNDSPLKSISYIPDCYYSAYVKKFREHQKVFRAFMEAPRSLRRFEEYFCTELYNHKAGEIEAREATGDLVESKIDPALIHHSDSLRFLKGFNLVLDYALHSEMWLENAIEHVKKTYQEAVAEKAKEMRIAAAKTKKKLEELKNSSDPMEQLEDYYWDRLGDSYREPKAKTRTKYGKKA